MLVVILAAGAVQYAPNVNEGLTGHWVAEQSTHCH